MKALVGAAHIMESSSNLKCAVCVYHNNEDEGLSGWSKLAFDNKI